MSESKQDWQEIAPLGELNCSSSACDRDLHCFVRDLRRAPKGSSYRNERCVSCGIDLINWNRLDKHDISDVNYTIDALEHERVRHAYWHTLIDDKSVEKALQEGYEILKMEAITRIQKSVGPPRGKIFRDGIQTPKTGNILYYAQHATATCCRKCIEVWHGIDRNHPLTSDEISYMADLLMLYIQKRVPSLAKHK